MDIDSIYEAFLARHGGDMRQFANAYLIAKPDFNLRKFILDFLDRSQSTLATVLLIADEEFLNKLEKFLQR